MCTLSKNSECSIDFSTVCQLRCKECSTAKGIIHNGIVGRGQLSLSSFICFVENNPQIKRIEMSNWGEIFLNKEIKDIMKVAHKNGIQLYCGNGTNFNDVDDDVLESLVRYKVQYLNLSIDGATQETYEKYRVKGNINKVFVNIERLNHYKNLYQSEYPKLSWQFIIFGHNEHEIPLVKQLCKKYNMAFNPKLNHSNFSPVIDKEFVRRESGLGVADRQEFKELHKGEYKAPCYQCFSSPQINWNGDILGCCVNKWRVMGNVFDTSLSNWEQSDYYQTLKKILFEGEEASEEYPCFHCPNYQKIKETHLTEEGLYQYKSYIAPALKDDPANK